MKLDILALVAHPDDVELSCSGTLINHIKQGYKVGIIDFTQGEMGTRGTPELRLKEAQAAGEIMGLSARENLGFRDVFFKNDEAHQLEVVKMLRKYKPDIVFTNAEYDRHPDHGKAAQLVVDACFISGLKKVVTELDGKEQEAWRPKNIFHMIQSEHIKPDFVVDVTESWEQKVQSIEAFSSQFHTNAEESAKGDQTFISTPDFKHFIEGRAREMGKIANCTFAEGFTKSSQIKVKDVFDLI
ncbi:bacillithiol biosynthesis deacetylase BshB1 [Sediminitomix flava]|uniref:Bacillithiol biosynthesis deacetylase BshB1 n=1 Tax=Sediminitomix flava TaxID=379075 RepID=A0A315ZAT9_SEDFL|nr:bacillithiol biosynthesis deacetylase BshB1 [Sediminitomix flava]PWJ42163.1 bacillithiol biosynthesis deacetylase BshB1 [Sediminitomix flava]